MHHLKFDLREIEFFAPTMENLIIWILIVVGAFFLIVFLSALSGMTRLMSRDQEGRGDDAAKARSAILHDSDLPEERIAEMNHSLVKRFDLLTELWDSAPAQQKQELVTQIGLIKDDFHEMLNEFSLKPIEFAPGESIDLDDRNEIVTVDSDGESNLVLETVRCGIRYEPENGEPRVLRKAEVRLGLPGDLSVSS